VRGLNEPLIDLSLHSAALNQLLMLSYNRNQLYDIVADVGSYPRFVPFCTGSRIFNTSTQQQTGLPFIMEAELTVRFLTFKESYVSQVTCTPFQSVEVRRMTRHS